MYKCLGEVNVRSGIKSISCFGLCTSLDTMCYISFIRLSLYGKVNRKAVGILCYAYCTLATEFGDFRNTISKIRSGH